MLAFLSLLTFLNATLTWFGDRVGVENLTFEVTSQCVDFLHACFVLFERQIFLFIGGHNPIMQQSSDIAISSKEISHLT